jgi:hypothetical protein
MTNQEAFKVGFLMKCAEHGLTAEETDMVIKRGAAMVKLAGVGSVAAATAKAGGKAAGTIGSALLNKLWWMGIVGPPVIGGLTGYALSGAGSAPYDMEEAKRQEELAEYQRAADELQRSVRNREQAF